MNRKGTLLLVLCLVKACFASFLLFNHFALPRIEPWRQSAVQSAPPETADPEEAPDTEADVEDDTGPPLPTGGAVLASSSSSSACRFERWENDTIQTVWQRPKRDVVGVAFLAHGCSHGAIDFCPRSDECPKCRPLPEERQIVEILLERGFFVIVVSSVNRKSKCWSVSHDIGRVNRTLHALVARGGLRPATTPLVVFGASSGGSFVADLAVAVRKEWASVGIISQVAVPSGAFTAAVSGAWCPRTVLSYMARDVRMGKGIRSAVAAMRQHGCPDSTLVQPLAPMNLTDVFLSDRAGVTVADSKVIFKQFLADGVIDPTGALLRDPRHNAKWRASIQKLKSKLSKKYPLGADRSAVAEMMNVAYGFHEMAADPMQEAMAFLGGG